MKNKAYENYKCSVCKRTIDLPFEPKSAFIKKCVITYGCTGNLHKISESNALSISSLYSSTVENWRPRGQKLSEVSPEKEEDVLYFAGTTEDNKLTIAVKKQEQFSLVNMNDVFGIKLKVVVVKDKIQPSSEFYFNISQSTNILAGSDNSVIPETLAFSTEDSLYVYKNGIRQFEVVHYKTSKTDSSILPNQIQFNTALLVGSIIEVIVVKNVSLEYGELRFIKNGTVNNSQAWTNIKTITKYDEDLPVEYHLFTLHDYSGININDRIQTLLDSSIRLCFTEEEFSEETSYHDKTFSQYPCIGLLAKPPFSIKDRILDNIYDLSLLNGVFNYLKLENNNGVKMFMVSDVSVSSVFPKINKKEYISFGGKIISDSNLVETSNKSDIIINKSPTSKFIIGDS